ncbi:MAG TPA: hypothetical protein VHT34_08730 [Clostridia bacterium]|nr:hypothetical protein [Clostridia bacterium]
MRHMNEIKPYNRYWGNCITNMFVSIMQDFDPGYEHVILMNDYEYNVTYHGFRTDYTKKYYSELPRGCFIFDKRNFSGSKEAVSELKEVIIENPYVTVNIDLYYWASEGAYFNKAHAPHYSIVTGFDEEKGLFYALEEDDNMDYGIREIPESRVLEAINSPDKGKGEDYRVMRVVKDNIVPYRFDACHFAAVTHKLIGHLDALIKDECFLSKGDIVPDIINLYRMGVDCSKVMNRFDLNIGLFGLLREHRMIDDKSLNEATAKAEAMKKRWDVIKCILFKHYRSGRFIDLKSMEAKLRLLFTAEKEMWTDLMSDVKMPDVI